MRLGRLSTTVRPRSTENSGGPSWPVDEVLASAQMRWRGESPWPRNPAPRLTLAFIDIALIIGRRLKKILPQQPTSEIS